MFFRAAIFPIAYTRPRLYRYIGDNASLTSSSVAFPAIINAARRQPYEATIPGYLLVLPLAFAPLPIHQILQPCSS